MSGEQALPADVEQLVNETKLCPVCVRVLPVDDFHIRRRRGRVERQGRCRKCSNALRLKNARRAHLRLVRFDQQQAFDPGDTCVCGEPPAHHTKGGKGGCAATGCPYFHLRGS